MNKLKQKYFLNNNKNSSKKLSLKPNGQDKFDEETLTKPKVATESAKNGKQTSKTVPMFTKKVQNSTKENKSNPKPLEKVSKFEKGANGKSGTGTVKKIQRSATKNNVEKRKIEETRNNTSNKKKRKSSSGSDSETEDYIHKFFTESDLEQAANPGSSEEDSDFTVSESNDEDYEHLESESSGMSFNDLLNYYGAKKDKHESTSSANSGQWMEEDNDIILEYSNSDDENKALIPVEKEESNDSETSAESDSDSDDEGSGDSYEEDDLFLDDDDDDDDDDDSAEFSSDSYDYSSYLDDSYDSEDDDDYVPSALCNNDLEENDDLYISRGQAKIYDVDDNHISFNSESDAAQIIEIPYEKPSSAESQVSDNDSCPDLVPISEEKGKKKTKAKGKVADEEEDAEMENVAPKNIYELCHKTPENNENEEEIPITDEDKANFKFFDSSDMRLSVLIMKDTLFFNGNLTVQVLAGHLEVLGYNFRKHETKNIYSARGYQYLNLTPTPDKSFQKSDLDIILQKLKTHFHSFALDEIEQEFDPNTSVLLLLQADSSNQKVLLVEKFMNEQMLFPKPENLTRSEFHRTEHLLNTQFYTKQSISVPILKKEKAWDTINLKKRTKVIVIGGKGAGKSTTCQYLINKNIQKFKRILLIDLDIGQPIQYIPETISATIVETPILGVGCFETSQPIKSYLFGSINVVTSPIKYIQLVKNLMEYCSKQSELREMPWVVNTMGYVTGFAEELMAAIMKFLQPTDAIQIHTPWNYFKNTITSELVNEYSFNILREEVQGHMKTRCNYKTHSMEASFVNTKRGYVNKPANRRDVILVAHLANILKDCDWFTDVKPFCAKLTDLEVLITKEDDKPPKELLPIILNSSLVYLCRKQTNVSTECYGIGIVRAVDSSNNVFLLSSLPTEILGKVNCLAVCSSSLPKAILLKQNPKLQGTIPYVYNLE